MELNQVAGGDALVAKVLDTRLDASSAPALKSRIIALIKSGHHHIALDLADVGLSLVGVGGDREQGDVRRGGVEDESHHLGLWVTAG